MAYYEIKLALSQPEPWKDIFTALLGEAGCDSFIDGDAENELLAYIKDDLYDEAVLRDLLENHGMEVSVDYAISKVEEQDWNAVWEANYEPVLLCDCCYIRAPFHEPRTDVQYEIIIEPKMSFGTAHHETTSLMIEYLLAEELAGKKVLDMGSGTGVLAILAHKRGASPITAIDNDKWAYENNIENNARNHTEDITVIHGDAQSIGNECFDVIIANINRNILVNDMPAYVQAMGQGSVIFFSGFYNGYDLDVIKGRAAELGLSFHSFKEKNNWVAARFVKEN